jgi:hypothetical protein
VGLKQLRSRVNESCYGSEGSFFGKSHTTIQVPFLPIIVLILVTECKINTKTIPETNRELLGHHCFEPFLFTEDFFSELQSIVWLGSFAVLVY